MPRVALMLLAAISVSRIAAADPTTGRVITAPTAWLPPQGAVTATAGVDARSVFEDKRYDGNLVIGYGLGGLAVIELGADSDVRTCSACDGEPLPEGKWLGRAQFKLGARQNAWFPGMPALAFGVRNTFAARSHGVFDKPRISEAYVVASRELPSLAGHVVRLHAGASLVEARFGDTRLSPVLRPLGAFEWIPGIYPKTTLMGDIAWVALLRPKADPVPPDGPMVEWAIGWGVRYQALRWGAIELMVRHRQDEGLQASTVMMRLHGVWERAAAH